ncbi:MULTISPECIES: alpha/beta hydrolase [unclassified Amycolatopsis]|uniref:alpha/beta fold hydrolase n=1 Tax=unclassified Amycolatopsis TaxID=2618356 RepID=UPI002875522B|nr:MULTISPECIES: alpha/beta hydrolase [unclassified Amycolatopsis]MDS0135024.1 alpha/beta hydrolase [Amycolatopsis sp. 505]MDS0148852.1 alpha/beta hydrolase [Amycolatopsis sp. CM201R]
MNTPVQARPPLTHVPLSSRALPSLDPVPPPWPAAFEEVGTARLHVRRTPGPDGVPAVYVHGLGGSSTNWTDLAALLSPVAGGTAIDLPGFGYSEPEEGFDFTLQAHADVVVKHIEAVGGPVHLFGNSMGGAIALLVAAQKPELVKTLTLISPAVPDLRLDPRRLSDPRMAFAYLPLVGARVRAQLAALGPRERAAQVIKLCFADPSRFPESRLDELTEEHGARAGFAWAAPAMARSTFAIFRAWSTLGKASLWSVAPLVKAPTLVVWGREDRVISVKRAVRTARAIPRARLLVLPRTGHVAQMERPVVVAKAVLGMWEHVEAGTW